MQASTWEARVLAFLESIMGHIFLDSLGYIELSAEDGIAQHEHMNKEREIRKETRGRRRRGKKRRKK